MVATSKPKFLNVGKTIYVLIRTKNKGKSIFNRRTFYDLSDFQVSDVKKQVYSILDNVRADMKYLEILEVL